MSDYDVRFSGIRRLYGVEGLERLRRSHVCVVGIGGVGSWAVEALARTGVGELTLIDLDEVCVSNVNRQLHALDGEIGQSKVEVMMRRVQAINPECVVHGVQEFFTAANAEQLLQTPFDFVFDAIDSISKKCLLISLCRDKQIPVMTSGGAGGRRNPAMVQVTDLSKSTHDRLLQATRKNLRTHFGFPTGTKAFKVPCVYSPEPVVYPQTDGTVCAQRDPNSDLRLNCDSGYGTASFVTGAFGLVAAGHIVQQLVESTPKAMLPLSNSSEAK